MFRNYKVDYPDVGYGAMSAEEVHKATLCILAFSTAHVMTVDELKGESLPRRLVPKAGRPPRPMAVRKPNSRCSLDGTAA
jgi:hypothetical protein